MAFTDNRSEENRSFQKWPFDRQHTDGNTHNIIHHQINDNAELNTTNHDAIRSIFMTDSSKTHEVDEENISQDQTIASMNRG